MTVNYIIVQEIQKSHGISEAHFIPNETLLEIDDLSLRLTTSLNDRYNNRNINRAKFRDPTENDTIFCERFRTFNTTRNAQTFIEFSKMATSNLAVTLQHVPFATGGYFVFIDYSVQTNINYTACFLVRNTDGLIFIRDEAGQFNISEQFHIDFEKLAVGCRINLDSYNGQDDLKYLNFITGKNEGVSEYFKVWINAYLFEDEKADSELLLNLMDNLPLPLREDGSQMSRDEFKRGVFDNIKATSNRKSVDLNILNSTYYGDSNVIAEYIEGNQILISTQFNARDNIVRKLVKFDAYADNIKISFPYELFDQNLIFTDPNQPDLVIIRSQNLANQIRLEEHN